MYIILAEFSVTLNCSMLPTINLLDDCNETDYFLSEILSYSQISVVNWNIIFFLYR